MSEKLSRSVDALFSRTALGIKPGLDVITELLGALGNPHESLRVIHVAGTNGKGSVCAMIESVLRASGKKTGLYTSPHLFRFNERFRVNGNDVSNADLETLIRDVEAAACTLKTRPPTFFEMSTAIAFEHFKRSGTDYAVIETGMGGRWDATNIVDPVLSVITRIAVDHTDYLGDDLEKIAWEKAGIIKDGVPVICGPMPVAAETVVYKEASEKKAPVLGSEESVFFHILETRRTDQLVDIEASGQGYCSVRLPLGGSYQVENCGIAVAALEDLSDPEGFRLQMKRGLEAVKWPGRFQVISLKPPMIFDGGHNPNAAKTLVKTLDEVFPRHENGIVFGCMKDKDVSGILESFAPSVKKIWAMTLPGERAMGSEDIVMIGKTLGMDIEPISDIRSARDWVESGKKRLLCFTGSLFLAEEIRKLGIQI